MSFFNKFFSQFRWKDVFPFLYDFFSSTKLAVFFLFYLFLLTFLGTLYQVDYGLYAAQQRYFYSWFFLIGGFIPLPSVKLVLLFFSINLVVTAYRRYRFRVAKMGIIMIHYGLLFLLIGSLVEHYNSQESFVSLLEGEETTFSEDYYNSELVVWKEEADANNDGMVVQQVQSYDLNFLGGLRSGYERGIISFKDFGISLEPVYYYEHATASAVFEEGVESVSGIKALNYQAPPKERERIMPGGLFILRADFLLLDRRVLLWEGEGAPYTLETANGTYYIAIQRKRYAMPFRMKLRRFTRELYYASDIPKRFESEVTVFKEGDEDLPARIYMNHPLRLDGLTFFQASFSMERDGGKRSIFAVVDNLGYLVPYISSLIVTLGMLYHFVYMMFQRRRKKSA